MRTNLLPAILIAGPPHSGKSVLSFLLTQKLCELGISHYLLRAEPDGEGNWYHHANNVYVRSLRQKYKGDYSPEFVGRICSLIDNRHLPLLVDVGGRPQGDQFSIMKACTHSILLFRTESDREIWERQLAEMDLLPIAELRSDLDGEDAIFCVRPILQGVISKLDRHNWNTGAVYGALLDRTAGICHYEESDLEKIHLQQAPYPVLVERQLAARIKVKAVGKRLSWQPMDLSRIPEFILPDTPRAIYGRGPVWLAGMLAAYLSSVPLAFFDARFGWLTVPSVTFQEDSNVKVQITDWSEENAQCLNIELSEPEIEPGDIMLQPIEAAHGLVLSGNLPRWYFAALTRALMKDRAWVGIDEPSEERIVVIYSCHPSKTVGETIPRPDTLLFPSPN